LVSKLEGSFIEKVKRHPTKDETGDVFGRPNQVELGILTYKGRLLII
jgi:hypothetical protein